MTSKTPDELAVMTPEERAAWRAGEDIAVFGVGFKRDRNGRPIEQGIGSPANPSPQHFAMLEKYEGKAAADAARARANKAAGTDRF
jgi:hypothetical protein